MNSKNIKKVLKGTLNKNNVAWYVMDTGFHVKMIYGENVGIYIGSANMTNSALESNFEMGIYEEYNKFDINMVKEYLNQLKMNAVKKAETVLEKENIYAQIVECYEKFNSKTEQNTEYKNLVKTYFPKQKYTYNLGNKSSESQKRLVVFFDTIFKVVYPKIENKLKKVSPKLQYLRDWEFSWLADQIIYNMARNWCDTIEESIKMIDEYKEDHVLSLEQYKYGHDIIKERNFSVKNKNALIKLAKSSYAIQGQPFKEKETKYQECVESWLEGSKKHSFNEVMRYFLDGEEDDLVVRFDKICKYGSDYKVKNLSIGSLGDILGIALIKHPRYDKCYPISNNLIQDFVLQKFK